MSIEGVSLSIYQIDTWLMDLSLTLQKVAVKLVYHFYFCFDFAMSE